MHGIGIIDMGRTTPEACPQCGTEFPEVDWDAEDADKAFCVALAHQIEGHDDVTLCSLRCLVGYLQEHGI